MPRRERRGAGSHGEPARRESAGTARVTRSNVPDGNVASRSWRSVVMRSPTPTDAARSVRRRKRRGRDVDRGDGPAVLGQPDGVTTLAAAQVQRGARLQRARFGFEDRVHPVRSRSAGARRSGTPRTPRPRAGQAPSTRQTSHERYMRMVPTQLRSILRSGDPASRAAAVRRTCSAPQRLWEDGSGRSADPLADLPGPLAQLVERRTFNPLVVGSSPTGPTNDSRRSATRPAAPG